ncbi:MAG: choloylglycine hydrolase [Oscillospiraceae bacterium]|nr:choloylglycine hydrolase [Oscillospiraceae bacterium]MDD6147154.1 choloylglycine hydrolase [Oscillospiraceae bacterium]
MCTAVSFKTRDHYFGRNLDLEYSYDESVTVTPRNYPFVFRHVAEIPSHYAMIGAAYIQDNYPLYYEATNEKGLSAAGLHFTVLTKYNEPCDGKDNIASFELIPWLLCQCESVSQVSELLKNINITGDSFSDALPPSPLHWIVSDKNQSLVIECVESGMKIYDNPIGVLTNRPEFYFHRENLSNYINLSPYEPMNRFSLNVDIKPYSRGMGALGLPGDLSSASRFIRAAFIKMNSLCGNTEEESVSQFFHILGGVEQQRGCVRLGDGDYEITVYSSCCNTDKGIYYFRTYNGSSIRAVDMNAENLDSSEIKSYPMIDEPDFAFLNKSEAQSV